MATEPWMSFILNHAADLGANTRAVLLIEMCEGGHHRTTRYSRHSIREDFVVCAFLAQQVVQGMFHFVPPGQAPHAPPALAPGFQPLQPPPIPEPIP